MLKREIVLQNEMNSHLIIIKNKTLMEYAHNFTRIEYNSIQLLNRISKVKIHKEILLPFNLVGINVQQVTKEFYNNLELSLLI